VGSLVTTIDIGGRQIGPNHPCFFIAEAGVNHNGSLEIALDLVDVAADVGADAVKFQTFKTERLVARNAPKANYQLETTGESESQFEMLKALELPAEAFGQLMARCNERNIVFLSSPFDEKSADLLQELNVPAFKIPSGEITNLPFLAHVARYKKPMIVSTGMAYLGEVETAIHKIKEAGDPDVILLHCVSNYPSDPANTNLNAMKTMSRAFNLPVGYSDHTLGIEVALAAVATGARVIEKHFTLDCNLSGPDHRASLAPDDLGRLIRGIRTVEASMGSGRKEPAESEASTADAARKSLVASRGLTSGTILTEEMIAIKRPGTGLPPSMRDTLVGRALRVDIGEDTLFALEMTE
jgi:N,N'-diacetyllegionaminate synthase